MPPEPLLSSLRTVKEQSPAGAKRSAKLPRSPKLVPINPEAGLIWKGAEYPTLEPGQYTVRGVKYQGPQWVRSYLRWSLRVEFALVHESVSVSAFFNFGSDPHGPRIARQGRFFKAWTLANGELPRGGQKMSPEVFLEGQFFEVEVEACNRDADGKAKPNAEVYSRITRIISAQWP